MAKPSFVYVTYIDTTADELWEALTNPDFTERYWSGRRIQSTWLPGASVEHVKPDGTKDWHGRVLEADRPNLLRYTFLGADEDLDTGNQTTVTFRIDSYGSVMKLTVTHEGIDPDSEDFHIVSNGWWAILSSLKTLLETGEAIVYPWKG